MNRNLVCTFATLAMLAGFVVPAAADEVVLISTHTRDFIGADRDANGILKGVPLETQALVVDRISLEGTKMAFRARDGKFVRAGIGQQTYLGAASAHIRGWETFEIVRLSASKFAIRSVQNGLYVRLGPDGRLAAVSGNVGSRETFSARPVAEQAEAAPPVNARPGLREIERIDLGGDWRIHRVRTFDGSLTPLPATLRDDGFVRFGRRGDVAASTGCNEIAARFRHEDELVQIGEVMTTKKLCLDESGTFELLLLIAFDHSRRVDDMGDQLRFFDVNGDPVMVLRR